MRFKEFIILQEAAGGARTYNAPRAPAPSGAQKVYGKGLQTGKGWDFPQMGYGYQGLPDTMTQWYAKYVSPAKAVEWRLLEKCGRVAQNIASGMLSSSYEEREEYRKRYGRHVCVSGSVGNGGWIRNIVRATLDGQGIVHQGIARGYQFSSAEVDWLLNKGIMEQHTDIISCDDYPYQKESSNVADIGGDTYIDINGDKLYQAISSAMSKQERGYAWARFADRMISSAKRPTLQRDLSAHTVPP